MSDAILGLDFGGTKLAAGLVNPASGALIASERCPTPAGGASAGLAAMLALAHSLLSTDIRGGSSVVGGRDTIYRVRTVVGVGVSFGGPVEADGRTVRLSMHIPGWEGLALAERLEREFGARAVVANDGDAAALAEHRFGAGRGVRHLLYLTVSTGIGGGVIVDGRLHRGERAWAGEVGHIVLKPDGPPCPCGRNGCLESLASGLSIARAAREQLHAAQAGSSQGMLARFAPQEITARDVALAAEHGDPLARQIWQAAMEWLGIGISSAANLLDPGRVVLGGGLTRAGALLFDPVRRVVAQRALDPAIEVVPAALGDDVGILGGAALLLA